MDPTDHTLPAQISIVGALDKLDKNQFETLETIDDS